MAHFYGRVKGGRGEATRIGTKRSGYVALAASWQGCVVTRMWHDSQTGLDMVQVGLEPWRGAGINRTLYCGPVGGQADK